MNLATFPISISRGILASCLYHQSPALDCQPRLPLLPLLPQGTDSLLATAASNHPDTWANVLTPAPPLHDRGLSADHGRKDHAPQGAEVYDRRSDVSGGEGEAIEGW